MKIKNTPPFRGSEEITTDVREFGAMSRCPVCECRWFQSFLTLNEDTHELSLVLLDVTCVDCGALYRAATQSDVILKERSSFDDEEEEQ